MVLCVYLVSKKGQVQCQLRLGHQEGPLKGDFHITFRSEEQPLFGETILNK